MTKLSGFVATLALVGVVASCVSESRQALQLPPETIEVRAGETLAGNYLAGRFAQHEQDWISADAFMAAVMEADGDNETLLQRGFLLSLGAGNWPRAQTLAERIAAESAAPDLALIYLAGAALADGKYAESRDLSARMSEAGFGQYTKPILGAWALAGEGKRDEAVALLQESMGPDDPSARIHAGLISEAAGDDAAAARHYRAVMENGMTVYSALAIASFHERTGDAEVARKIRESLGKIYPAGVFRSDLAKSSAGPANGAALALFELASVLYEKRAYDSALVYARIVERLNPSSGFAQLMIGDILAVSGRAREAAAAYARVPADSPVRFLSRVRTAETMEESGDIEGAITLLRELAADPEGGTKALAALGDIYRRLDRYAEAVGAYTGALERMEKLDPEHWPVVYARGMALERLNDWSRAEKDLLKALELDPDNPLVLNYIGYTWADRGENLDRAHEMLKKAVMLKPTDGYILDSYGWVLYRMGDYDSAILWIERAIERVPGDATILDHLGDAYWQAGRKTEAFHNWQRAMDLATEPALKERLAKKARRGLPPAELATSAAPKL